MASRDAWKDAEGISKEAAQKAYVDKLLEVRFVLNACCPITGSRRACVSQHILFPPTPFRALGIVHPRFADCSGILLWSGRLTPHQVVASF